LNQARALTLPVLLFLAAACAKKEPKPLHSEPWLAHPPKSADAASDAAPPRTRYTLSDRSRIRFELPSRSGTVRGSLGRVSGELELELTELAQSRAQVRADLDSIDLDESTDPALLARVRNALELSDAGQTASVTSFDLTRLEDLSPSALEPAPEGRAASPFTRRARGTAVGNLLLHGFRVVRRIAVEVDFGFGEDRRTPSTVLIRNRTPLVISLETHAIQAVEPETREDRDRVQRLHPGAHARAPEALVNIELYGTKID